MAKQTNQEKVLAGLLSTNTIAEAAKKSKISEPTIYRYLSEDDFKKRYRAVRRELLEGAISQIQLASCDAVNTLKRNLTCGAPSTEVRAAQILLDTAIKGSEHLDILERIELLEETQTGE